MVFMLGHDARSPSTAACAMIIARMLAPLLRRLFPEVPPNHPAMGAMVMNMASNMLGLGKRRDALRPEGDGRARPG